MVIKCEIAKISADWNCAQTIHALHVGTPPKGHSDHKLHLIRTKCELR